MLKNKFAIITGSNRGIGLSILKKFSENNANIIACSRVKSDKFEKEITNISSKYNNKIIPVYFDLLKESEINRGVEQIKKITSTIDVLVKNNLVRKLDLGDGRARYENADQDHHDHLIDVKSGKVIEFQNPEIERLQTMVATELGYKLVGHRLELYAVPLSTGSEEEDL